MDRLKAGAVVLLTMLCGMAFGALMLECAGKARAHEAPSGWSYPTGCCSGQDCREISEKAIDETGQGFRIIKTGELLPASDGRVKPSPDGKYHLCTWQGRDDTSVICLFVPPRGV